MRFKASGFVFRGNFNRVLVFKKTKIMLKLKIPLSQKDISKLKIGDKVLLNGTIFTARDKVHEFLLRNDFKKIENSVIYHCGPIVRGFKIIAAGPTTSNRLNSFIPKLIQKYKIKAIIGKGGMDNSVLNALKGKSVYFAAIGGAAVLYAELMKIKNVYKKEFGMTEAIWELEVKDFPVIVAMDSKGNSLYDKVYQESKVIFQKLIKN
jgi:fumarate hydratase subunit beta